MPFNYNFFFFHFSSVFFPFLSQLFPRIDRRKKKKKKKGRSRATRGRGYRIIPSQIGDIIGIDRMGTGKILRRDSATETTDAA